MICKIVLTVTVLLEADTLKEADTKMSDVVLSDIAYEIADGEWAGGWEAELAEEVPVDRIEDELRAVGYDGDFFEKGE